MGITAASYKYLRKSPCETNWCSVRSFFDIKSAFLVLPENFAPTANFSKQQPSPLQRSAPRWARFSEVCFFCYYFFRQVCYRSTLVFQIIEFALRKFVWRCSESIFVSGWLLGWPSPVFFSGKCVLEKTLRMVCLGEQWLLCCQMWAMSRIFFLAVR
jgi:hypothetical protein